MKEIEIFYLTGCPYCAKARKAAEELCAADERFAAVPLRWIEESREKELADSRDYYYVPALYIDGVKCYEAAPGESYESIRDNLRRVYRLALED